jgi:hypothetical protein
MLIDKAQCDVNSTSNDRSTRRNAGVKHNFDHSNHGVFTQRPEC